MVGRFFAVLGLVIVSAFTDGVSAAGRGAGGSQVAAGTPSQTILGINNLTVWVRNDGFFHWAVNGDESFPKGSISWLQHGAWNGTFPKGTVGAVFCEGMVWGGQVKDGVSPSLRVGGSTFQSGLWSGKILTDNQGKTSGRENPLGEDVRVYRVRMDWRTADLRDDAVNYYRTNDVTDEMIVALRSQYETDWNQWPASKGAPFSDRNSNGVYDPATDVPGMPGADQTIWFVANDLEAGRARIYGSPPIGLEMQYTIWAYNRGGAFNDMNFRRVKVMYKGTQTTPASARIDSMFLVQWADPDIGSQHDDQVGCDTTLNLGYGYQYLYYDRLYNEYELLPPAVGYTLLQGPIVPGAGSDVATVNFRPRYGFRNLPMTSFIHYAAASGRSDPQFENYKGTRQWYNLMRGYVPRPESTSVPLRDHLGRITRFEYSGDPVAGTGFLDSTDYNRGDRRIVISSGPFSMALGDTQEVVYAQVGGHGYDRLNSVTRMKEHARIAREAYATAFSVLPPKLSVTADYSNPQAIRVKIQSDARNRAIRSLQAIFKRHYSSDPVMNVTLYDDGSNSDAVAGDQIYSNTIVISPQIDVMHVDVEASYTSGAYRVWERLAQNVVTAGRMHITAAKLESDNLNDDSSVNPGENIYYSITLRNNTPMYLRKIKLTTRDGMKLVHLKLDSMLAWSNFTQAYNPDDTSTCFRISVPSEFRDSVFRIPFIIENENRNIWYDTVKFQVVPWTSPPMESRVGHTGPGDWELRCVVVDASRTKPNSYEISVVDSINAAREPGFNLRDLTWSYQLLGNYPMPHPYAHNIPITDGFKVMRGKNFGMLGLRKDSTRWISPHPIWFRGIQYVLDPHFAFEGGVTTGAMLDYYFYHIKSSFSPAKSVPVEVRFDSTKPQKAYRLHRSGPNTGYMIQPDASFITVPFSVWDVSNRQRPRQLTVAFRDQNWNWKWDPPLESDNFEVVHIYYKTYDPTGSTQFTMPPNAVENECTWGAKADIMYSLSIGILTGHKLSEKPGILYLRPYIALSSKDKFTFNPTVTSVRDNGSTPMAFELSQNFPNPFNPVTTIRFTIPRQERATLKIYNILGQEVVTLVDQELDAGSHAVEWAGVNSFGQSLATGVYFYKLEAGTRVEVKKMLMVK